jgi:hypothetical protein
MPLGGGIAVVNGTLVLTNATVVDNQTPRDFFEQPGPGVSGAGSVQSTNSIIAGNTSGGTLLNCEAGLFTSLGNNLSDDASCFTASGSDLVVANVMLGPLSDNGGPTQTHLPLMASPAIDNGHNATCPRTDQRGVLRPFDGNDPPDGMADCDIGAVELPEPGFLLQLGAGLAFLLTVGRRRMRA